MRPVTQSQCLTCHKICQERQLQGEGYNSDILRFCEIHGQVTRYVPYPQEKEKFFLHFPFSDLSSNPYKAKVDAGKMLHFTSGRNNDNGGYRGVVLQNQNLEQIEDGKKENKELS